MDRIVDVAAYVFETYNKLTDETLDEMKLHKLLYFTQRESFAITGHPAFNGNFEGWIYGPVSKQVREEFSRDNRFKDAKPISAEVEYIVNNVILEYGSLASWKLSKMSHEECSWKNSRKGLAETQNGSVELALEDIKKDAMKIRPYDHVWDMYYDEYEDYIPEKMI